MQCQQEYDARVVRQEFDDKNTLLVIITLGECNNNMLQDNNNKILKNITEPECKRLQFYANRLHVEENVMLTLKEAV